MLDSRKVEVLLQWVRSKFFVMVRDKSVPPSSSLLSACRTCTACLGPFGIPELRLVLYAVSAECATLSIAALTIVCR